MPIRIINLSAIRYSLLYLISLYAFSRSNVLPHTFGEKWFSCYNLIASKK